MTVGKYQQDDDGYDIATYTNRWLRYVKALPSWQVARLTRSWMRVWMNSHQIYDKYQSANNKYQFWIGEVNCLLTFWKKEKLKDLGGLIGNILLLKFLSISFSIIKHGTSFTSTKLHKPLLTLSIIHITFSIKYIKHFFCVWIIFLLFLIQKKSYY